MTIKNCMLCPRKCGAERTEYKGSGFCGMGALPVVARAALHFWEEPCISGKNGSGTVFFAGCSLRCVFCQNAELTQQRFEGVTLTPEQLSQVFFSLAEQGAHNINLVTPTHFIPAVAEALSISKLPVPVVYNCGGYESVDALRRLEGLVDIYLPDMKYSNPELAKKYSFAEDYPETALAAIEEMLRQVGEAEFDENGMMKKGVIVRQLILPGRTRNSMGCLDMLRERFGSDLPVSLMAQYVPCGKVDSEHYSEINRKITRRELEKVSDYMFDLGFDGYVQDLNSAEKAYIPSFRLEGLDTFTKNRE